MLEEWKRGDRPAPSFAHRVTFTITEADIERWPMIIRAHPEGIVIFAVGENEVRELWIRPHTTAPGEVSPYSLPPIPRRSFSPRIAE